MPYNSVKDLPPAVRNKLKGKKRRQWMHVWNSEYNIHGDESRAFAGAWSAVQKGAKIDKDTAEYQNKPRGSEQCSHCSMFREPDGCTKVLGSISSSGWCKFFDGKENSDVQKESEDKADKISKGKVNMENDFNFYLPLSKVEKQKDGSVIVSGYASTPSLDLDNEIVSLDAVKKALPGYWEWRNIREMHQPSAVGVGKEANIDGTGLFLTSRITDPVAAQKCLDEVYKGYSIGGKKLAKQGNTITEIELIEVSLVDRPANPDCRINVSKRAKDGKEAYLIKAKIPKDAKSKALVKMAAAVEILSKEGPPAAKDGFSLPAEVKKPELSPNDSRPNENETRKDAGACEAHGIVGCKDCMDKRDVGEKERSSLADQGDANPDGGFPIKNKDDLDNARQAFGRAKNKPQTRRLISRRARELGVKLPDKWKKKQARKMIKRAEKAQKMVADIDESLQIWDDNKLSIDKFVLKSKPSTSIEDFQMAAENTNGSSLDAAILDVIKRASEPSKAQRMQMCKTNIDKVNKSRKAAMEAVKKAHGMVKGAYLAKKAGSKKPNDGDDDDMPNMMKMLQKAYGDLSTQKTFIKAAKENLSKASGRKGQQGQEAGDAESGFYEVPMGVKDLSPAALAGASPGGKGNAGQPPPYPGSFGTDPSSVYDGKMAKFAQNGMVPVAVAELIAENAQLASKAETLSRMPSGNRRPYTFDMNKVAGEGGQNRDASSVIFNGVDPAALGSDNPELHKKATAQVIGNLLLAPQLGKSIIDPSFKGAAGGGKVNN